MAILKLFATVLLTLIIGLCVIGIVLPDHMHVERRIKINAPQAAVAEVLSGFTHFNDWSPWAELDPEAKYTFEGPATGKGAIMRWQGNEQAGAGTQTILKVVSATAKTQAEGEDDASSVIATKTEFRSTVIEIELQFAGWDPARTLFKIDELEQGVQVAWAMDMDLGWDLVGRYFGFFMDDAIGNDYEKGLNQLKTYMESKNTPAGVINGAPGPINGDNQPAPVPAGLPAAREAGADEVIRAAA